jgi:site-specific DNA recombinase
MTNENNQTKKFFIYARKSTDSEDRQVRSIQDQIAELKELAKKENLEVVDVLVEKQTAKKPGRPVFAEMLKRIEAGEATGILAWHPDRLARNSVDGGQIIYLVDTGVIKELKFPTFWFDPTPQGKFMLSIAFGQSKYYIDNLSENIKQYQTRTSPKIEKWTLASNGPAWLSQQQRDKTNLHRQRKSAAHQKDI